MHSYRIYLAIVACFICTTIWGQLPKPLDSLFVQGTTLYEKQEYMEAASVLNTLIEKAEQHKYYAVHIIANNDLGVFYNNKQNHDKALGYFFKVIDIAQNKLDTPLYSAEDKARVVSETYMKIGKVYYNQRNYKKSEEYLEIAHDIAMENGYVRIRSMVLNNLGEIRRLTGNPHAALASYKKAMKIKIAIQDSIGRSICLSNIGATYVELELLDSAKWFYDRSYEMAQQLNIEDLVVNSFRDYTTYYQALGQFYLAEKWGQKALALVNSQADLNVKLNLYKQLATIYGEQEEFDSCALYQQKWIDLSEVIHKQKNEKLALEIEAKFLIKEKEKELAYLKEKRRIEEQSNQLKNYFQWLFILSLVGVLLLTLITLNLLRKKNKKLAESWGQINQQNTEKELLLKEIHHRVKNNLQVITSLLSLQSHSIDDARIKSLFSQSQHRINSMAMIHQMLYQSNNFSKINGKEYLEQLIDKLVVSFKGPNHHIQIDSNVPTFFINIDTSIPLGLLINEIVVNALKYGLPNDTNGVLTLEVKPLESSRYSLTIGENGKGYEGDLKTKKSNSLGLRLIQQLAVQLRGEITKIDRGIGTYYCLVFQEI